MSEHMPVTRAVYQAAKKALLDARNRLERDKAKVEALEFALRKMEVIAPAYKDVKGNKGNERGA